MPVRTVMPIPSPCCGSRCNPTVDLWLLSLLSVQAAVLFTAAEKSSDPSSLKACMQIRTANLSVKIFYWISFRQCKTADCRCGRRNMEKPVDQQAHLPPAPRLNAVLYHDTLMYRMEDISRHSRLPLFLSLFFIFLIAQSKIPRERFVV